MKRCLILLAVIACACSKPFDPAKKATDLVRRNYPDCEKIIMVKVDTVTLGENLQYRIERQKGFVKDAEADVARYSGYVKEFRSSKSIAASYRQALHHADSVLNKRRQLLFALDSLKDATLDMANTPAAYQVCVAYNYPNNLVWIQLDYDGTLLKMSKRMSDLLFSPGRDMPGYLEVLKQ